MFTAVVSNLIHCTPANNICLSRLHYLILGLNVTKFDDLVQEERQYVPPKYLLQAGLDFLF